MELYLRSARRLFVDNLSIWLTYACISITLEMYLRSAERSLSLQVVKTKIAHKWHNCEHSFGSPSLGKLQA
ncbi:hypothetical protein BDR03DRAFT_959801 [Suillus americanus]|nr:hypothetical protein BDR03DRAFT_959801 [Suillus americanus]